MTEKDKALWLAELLAEFLAERPHDVLDLLPVKAAAELRRLHEENGRLKTMLSDVHEKALAAIAAVEGEKE